MQRSLGLILLVAVMSLVTTASPVSADTLGATNVVTGSTTAYVDVELSEAVQVSFEEDPLAQPTFKVEGGGSFGGVVLYQLGRADYPGIAVAGRFQRDLICVADNCPDLLSAAGQSTGHQLAWNPQTAALGPGRYRLFLVSDGSPVKATIKLPELSGDRSFAPSKPVFESTVAGLQRIDPWPTDHFDVFSGGAQLDSDGIAFMTARVQTAQNTGQVDIEVCNYGSSEPATTDFYPGCSAAGADPSLVYGNSYIVATEPVSVDWVFELGKGGWQTGGNISVIGGIESSAWAVLWLPLSGPPDGTASAPVPPAAPTTDANGAGGPGSPPRGGAGNVGRLHIPRKARLRGRKVTLPVRCTGGPCRGRLTLAGGRAAYDVKAGHRHTIVLRVKRGRRGKAILTVAEAGFRVRRISLTLR